VRIFPAAKPLEAGKGANNMTDPLVGLGVLLGGMLTWLGWERVELDRAVRRIPYRIHVNGTRGKSSVTRLIAAGLRAGGMATWAKTTGSQPRIIDLLGKDHPIQRLGGAGIGEQTRFLRYFGRFYPQAVVMECMAVQPAYQWITEHQMIRATHGVITNVRPDHLEEMGPTLEQIARSLANTIPRRGHFFTTEKHFADLYRRIADQRGTSFHLVDPAELPEEVLRDFTYLEHRDNVALALAVCTHLGVDAEQALEGMRKMAPDPGALRIMRFTSLTGEPLYFANAFAANDPQSTAQIWELVTSRPDFDPHHIAVLLNTRTDRRSRTRQLLELVTDAIRPQRLIYIGEASAKLRKELEKQFGANLYLFPEESQPEEVVKTLRQLPPHTLVFGMGNIVGRGFALLEKLEQHQAA